jgi:hypothetical protein
MVESVGGPHEGRDPIQGPSELKYPEADYAGRNSFVTSGK